MSEQTWFLIIAAALFVYYTVRRWVVLNIFSNLVAGTLANPLRAKWLEELVAKRDRLASDSKEYERVEDSIAELDPMCIHGRRHLLDAAWEIYHECHLTKRKLSLK